MNNVKRKIASLLAVVIFIGIFPFSAFAQAVASDLGSVRVIIKNETFSVADGAVWDGVLIDEQVSLDGASSMMSCITAALDAHAYTQTGAETGYITAINGLESMASSTASGWMGTLNDWFVNEGFNAFTVESGKLESGDEICLMYTMAFGEDLGGTFSNNNKTLSALSFSGGELSPAFSSDVHSYALTLPAGTSTVKALTTAANKNFQVKSIVGGKEYKRGADIPVSNGAVIEVKCGEIGWPTSNNQAGGTSDTVPAETYSVTVVIEGSGASDTNTAPYWGMPGYETYSQELLLGESCALYLEYELYFFDDEDDELTYYVSVDGAAAEEAVADDTGYYVYTPETAGVHTLYFTAFDGDLFSNDGYTVTLNVTAPSQDKSIDLRFSTARIPADYTFEVTDSEGKQIPLGEIKDFNSAWKSTTIASISNGVYTITAKSNGVFAGSCMFEVNDNTKNVLLTSFLLTANTGFAAGTDYTATAEQTNNAAMKNIPYISKDGYNFIATNLTPITITVTPSQAKLDEGFAVASKSISPYVSYDKYAVECAYAPAGAAGTDTITVPSGARVEVGVADISRWYLPFKEVLPVGDMTSETGKDTYSYNFEKGIRYCYRVSSDDKMTVVNYVNRANDGTSTIVTDEQLAQDVHQILRNDSYYGSGVLTNAGKTGAISLNAGQSFKIDALRSWQIVDNEASNYMVEPDFHYTVLTGAENVTVDADGVITALQNGDAVIAVTYDVIEAFGHTYGAIYPEETGVIVVKVGSQNAQTAIDIDSELDVMYYDETQDGADYTFNANDASVSSGVVYGTSFSGFSNSNVTLKDGAATVKLRDGKNIIKIEKNGEISYNVISAKKVSVHVHNVTKNEQVTSATPASAGDTVKITINGLDAALGKLACLYNYQNDLKMTGENGAKFGAGWTPLEWGGASYDFITKRNSVTFTPPSDWSGTSYSLTGAVTSSGYGAEAGVHRSIDRVNGESPNLAAVSRSYDYSVLPKIVIPVHQKPKSDIYATTGDWIYKNTQNPIVSSTGGEWAVIGLARAGYAVSDGYYASYASNVISTLIKNNGVLHAKKYTEYSRAVLALTAIGYDVTNVGGYNLLDRLADFDAVCWQGVNGPIWALLALDSHGYEIPAAPAFKTRTTREKLVSAILEKELTSGGWTLAGNAADVDMTAMAIQALAPYYSANGAVKAAVDRALNKLSQLQNENGGFGSIDGASAESSAQVIVALTALGIDPDADSRFIKNGSTVIASLNSFYVDGGGFSHGANGSRDGIATEQGYYALAAYNRFKAGKSSLFNMSDVKIADAVQIVNSLINSIGSVTIDSGNTIKAARTAYDALVDSQKSMINNLQALIDAENTYKTLIAKVDNVSALIARLNDVKYSAQFKAMIDEARSAYNALSEAEQKHVGNYPLLTAAERKYTQLENAQRVIDLIDAIGTVTKNSADKIDAARSAYDALSKAEQALVTNYSVLTAAERKLTALVAGGSTKVIGNGNTKLSLNGITYMVDAEAATLMKQIDTLTKAKKLNMKLLATAYTAYMDMSDKLKAQVFNYDDLEALTNKAGEENHTDAATGIQIGDAPWYVKINVKKSVDKSVSDIIKNSIGSNEMLMLWDINLIDMLKGAEYYPDASITLSAPADDLSRFSQVRIAHYDGSKNEYLDCTVADGRITWQTQSFSTFAVIGSEAATLNELENSDKPSVMAATSPETQAASPMWVIVLIFALTAAGIAAIAVVIILKRKAKR